MPPASVTVWIARAVFCVVMLPLFGYIFQTVCNLCGADPPSFRRGILTTVLVAAAAFFFFDGIGYGIMMASRDTIELNLPEGFNYWGWLREPLYLKWQALGLIPLIRWILALMAVAVAGTLYVFILVEPYRNCIVILLIQWTLNVVAMAVVWFALSTTLRFVTPPPEGSNAPEVADGAARTERTQFSPVPPEKRAATRPRFRREGKNRRAQEVEKASGGGDNSAAPVADLKDSLNAHQGAAEPSQGAWRKSVHALDENLGPYLEPIKTASEPYTKHLPLAVQEFLDDGGWWLVVAALAVATGFWLRALWRRCRRALFHKGRHRHKRGSRDKRSAAVIDLDLVADAFTDPGAQQITVRGQPGRLRLVVMAPSPSYVGELSPEMADTLLDWLQPGLGEILDSDNPRRVVWPRHPGLGQFVQMFQELVQIPEVKGRRSPWLLISGAAHLGRQTVFLGLAVFLDKTSYQREIQVQKEKWNEVLGVQKVTEPV
jgi:hypothetical protein